MLYPLLACRQAGSVAFRAPTTTFGDQRLHCNQGYCTDPIQRGPARHTPLPPGPADRISHQSGSHQAALNTDILHSMQKQRLNKNLSVCPENAFREAPSTGLTRASMTPQSISAQLKRWSLHRCTCQGSSVGNGFVCYGNIMERLQDLNTEVGGQWQGKLTSALSLMGKWPHVSRVSSCCLGGLILPSPNCLCCSKVLPKAWHCTPTTHRLPLTTQSCLCSPHFTVYKNFQ